MTTIVYLYEQKFRAWRKRLAGIYRFSKENGWNVRVLEISEVRGNLGNIFDFWHASGAIVEGGIAESAKVKSVLCRELPLVFCDFDAKQLGVDCFGVLHDPEETVRAAVGELLKKACLIYGYVGFDVKREWSIERERAFVALMAQAGRDTAVYDPTAGRCFRDAIEFYGSLEEWLGSLSRPFGIFAANDEMGEHVLRAARNRGIAVPDEMIVVSVDNDELICESTEPTLTSVSPDFEKSGYLAAEILQERLSNPHAKPRIERFGAGLVVGRESTRAFKCRDHTSLKAVEYIRLHACEGIKVPDVVAVMGMARRSAEMRFMRFVGHSILREIEQERFRRACEQLRLPDVQLDRLHEAIGFGNARSLRALFYRLTGQSPTAWRATQLSACHEQAKDADPRQGRVGSPDSQRHAATGNEPSRKKRL